MVVNGKQGKIHCLCEDGIDKCPSRSPFVITLQASGCQIMILGLDFSIPSYTHFTFLCSYCSTLHDCNGEIFQQHVDSYFHFEVLRSSSYGYIETLKLKDNHVFDVNQLTIKVNPIVCYTGLCHSLLYFIINISKP